MYNPNFTPSHWQWQWWMFDGFFNIIYLIDLSIVMWLWRPTANNRRFAMSDELTQDDDGGFEIASYRGSLDDLDEVPSADTARSADSHPQDRMPASMHKPSTTTQRPARQSLDGETIFAVGEDGDKWSDDEGSLDHHAGKSGT